MSQPPAIPPAGYHIGSDGKLHKNPTLGVKPEPQYISVYNNPNVADKYRRLGYIVNHIQPDDTNGW